MDYEKAYKNALAHAREIHRNECEKRRDMEWLFPELKESEDERIRKGLINYFNHHKNGINIFYGIKGDDILAWLEKQGECHISHNDEIMIKQLTEYFTTGHGLQNTNETVVEWLNDVKEKLEKQGEQKPLIEMKSAEESLDISSKEYNDIVNDCLYGESKPADKVEPKFKIGDWVVSPNGVYWHIDLIRNGRYEVTADTGQCGNWQLDTNIYRLWTIEDARDGDVLACENGWTCIFKCLNDNLFSSYCFMDHEGWFCEDGGQGHTLDNRICGEIYPATKEQHDLLFSKMHEAGYEWDAEKKELKLLITNGDDFFESENCEQKPSWSEEDEKMLADACIMLDWYQGNNWWKAQHIKNWLKALKQRCAWKPSDEQIEILDMVLTNESMDDNIARILRELREQLKKLREE